MKSTYAILPVILLSLLLGAPGCGGPAPSPAAEAPATPAAAQQPATTPPAATAEVGELPAEPPDKDEDPAGFWQWRVERMFADRDADHDGMISRDEFTGMPDTFETIDADGDELLTKEEVSNHVFETYVLMSESPAQ